MTFSIFSITVSWRDILDIALVTLLFYYIILMVRRTRAVAAVYGLVLMLAAYFMARTLGLITLNLLLENVLGSLFLLIVIVFQRDIRQALTDLGSRSWSLHTLLKKKEDTSFIGTIADAAFYMAHRNIGALIVLERSVQLNDTTERGLLINAVLSKELLISIFWPNSPLHDGATILHGNKILTAGCILPLSTALTKRDYGTRHRAALGITEESDAIAIVVSEERGVVTISVGGKLTAPLDEHKLPLVLKAILERKV